MSFIVTSMMYRAFLPMVTEDLMGDNERRLHFEKRRQGNGMRIPLIVVTIFVFLMSYAACGTKGDNSERNPSGATSPATATPEPTQSSAITPSGPTVAPDVPFSIEATGENKDHFNLHRVSTVTASDTTTVTATDFTQSCVAAKGEIVTCIADAEEFTFYAQDLNLHYTVPSQLCDYVKIEPFYFVNHKTKYYLPTDTLTIYVGKDGTVGTAGDNAGAITTPLDCYAEGADPVCCVGKYNQATYKWDESTNEFLGPTLTTVNRPLGSCLGGPASLTESRTPLGEIAPKFYYVASTGISSDYKIPATSNQLVTIAWNVNYFAAADHAGSIPQAFKYSAGNGLVLGNPYYSVSCYNRSWELNSQIRVQLRDWNTKADFENRATDPTTHDRVGLEPAPNGTKPINDELDWKDLEGAGVLIPDFVLK